MKVKNEPSSITPSISSDMIHGNVTTKYYDQQAKDENKLPFLISTQDPEPMEKFNTSMQPISTIPTHSKRDSLTDKTLARPHRDYVQSDLINAIDPTSSSNQDEIPIIKPLPTIDDILMTSGNVNKPNEDPIIDDLPINYDQYAENPEPNMQDDILYDPLTSTAANKHDKEKDIKIMEDNVLTKDDYLNSKASINNKFTVTTDEPIVDQSKSYQLDDIQKRLTENSSNEQRILVDNNIIDESDDSDDSSNQEEEIPTQAPQEEATKASEVVDHKDLSNKDDTKKNIEPSKMSFESSTSDDDSSISEQSNSSKKSLSNIEESINYDPDESENQQKSSIHQGEILHSN